VGAVLPPAKDHNILVISFDAMRSDALGYRGYPRNTTPNIDAFAKTALTFENAWSSAPVTPTSFASAFSGKYPYRVFIGWQLMPIKSLAQVMSDSGRHTFGLFHNVQVAVERQFDQGFDEYTVYRSPDEELVNTAKQVLEENRERPFFGWVHFINPHPPYHFREMSSHLAGPATEGRFADQVPGDYEVFNDEELQRARDLYDGEMFYSDYLFGRMLENLEALGLMDNTIIVLTTDHGEEFMEHGNTGHKSLFEEVAQIPMLIRHPDVQLGSSTRLPYSNIDLLPTLASMVGQPIPEGLDGLDLRATVALPRTRIITGMTSPDRYQIAVERGGQKLYQRCRPEFEELLFDLNTDPGEKNNIILDNPALASELSDLLLSHTIIEPCTLIANSSQGKAPEDLLSPEQIEELKSQGYIQ
jgi:arylsulfatase A-like enzyme